ncbi:MAG: 3-hydroxyacyl-CoA dehydrogenase NAD-binding domain-containing protein [Pseudomonadota bacterium]
MTKTPIGILGAGVIGASWASLFLAAGHRVQVYDVADGFEDQVRRYIEASWPVLEQLGLTDGDPSAVTFFDDPAKAVADTGFIQESVPERLPIKHELFSRIEGALDDGAIVSSSASGLTLTQMQECWKDPSPLILGHPFNPPHLIPLVELMANDRTAPDALEKAEEIYHGAGKVTIRMEKEIDGHVANRMQAALWREAIHLVNEGVASVEDVDKAIWAGPGLRWAAMGPNMIFNMAAGPGGLEEYCNRFAPSFHGWWDNLGDPRLDTQTVARLTTGVADEAAGRSLDELYADRDALILAMLKATRGLR